MAYGLKACSFHPLSGVDPLYHYYKHKYVTIFIIWTRLTHDMIRVPKSNSFTRHT